MNLIRERVDTLLPDCALSARSRCTTHRCASIWARSRHNERLHLNHLSRDCRQLGVALLEAGLASSVVGIDLQIRHLAQARHAASDLPYFVVAQDLKLPFAAMQAMTVLLIDVLYQLADDAQHAVLVAACGAAHERIVIRTLDPDRGVRSRLTVGVERLMRPLSPHSGALVNPWKLARLLALLTECGFAASVKPCWGRTPWANVLIIARQAR